MGTGSSKRKKTIVTKVETIGRVQKSYSRRKDEHVRGEVNFTDTSSAWTELRQGLVPDCNNLPVMTLRYKDFNKITRKMTSSEDDIDSRVVPYKTEHKVRQEHRKSSEWGQ